MQKAQRIREEEVLRCDCTCRLTYAVPVSLGAL